MTTLTTGLLADRLAIVEAALGPPPSLLAHPAVLAAGQVADTWRSDAETVDVGGVTRERVDLAARSGLLALTAPVQHGGGGEAPAVARAVTEQLAGACGTTWFVTAQHALPVSLLVGADEPVRSRLLRPLCDGQVLAATAVSHLRRPGPPAVRARPSGNGWELSGHIGWLTSWGLADDMVVGAATADGRLVFAYLPATEQPGLQVGSPLATAAMRGTRTTTLELDAVQVPESAVVQVVEAGPWCERDLAKTANVVPAVFGLLHTTCGLLVQSSGRDDTAAAGELAVTLAETAADVRHRAYRLIDEVAPIEQVPQRLALRAHALQLLVHGTSALVATGAGAAMATQHPAQRLAREALFHLVQAQTADVRRATLERWAATVPAGR